eukprot:1160685-Pelagomonas_calceolata.AAC.8
MAHKATTHLRAHPGTWRLVQLHVQDEVLLVNGKASDATEGEGDTRTVWVEGGLAAGLPSLVWLLASAVIPHLPKTVFMQDDINSVRHVNYGAFRTSVSAEPWAQLELFGSASEKCANCRAPDTSAAADQWGLMERLATVELTRLVRPDFSPFCKISSARGTKNQQPLCPACTRLKLVGNSKAM